jgi:hypothetical protein
MSTESKLTPQDPVDKATLQDLAELENSRAQTALQLLDLEQERVRLLGAAHQIDKARDRLFESILIERGLAPTARVSIDVSTGILTTLKPGGPVPEPVTMTPETVESPAQASPAS